MKFSLSDGRWNPYVAGAFVGILATVTVIATSMILGKPQYLGASTTFVRVAGLTEQAIVPAHVAENPYFTKTKIKIDWQMMVVLGIFFGAFTSSRIGGTARLETVPPVWRERFGNSPVLRGFAAFAGGAILLFGARLAGGCPSGHGLSGNMQLAVSGLLSLAFFIVAGVITAKLVYGNRR